MATWWKDPNLTASDGAWTVAFVTRNLRGDPDGFWQSNDYVLAFCWSGIIAIELSRVAMMKAMVANGPVHLDEHAFSGKHHRYLWADLQELLVRNVLFSRSLITIRGHAFIHSFRTEHAEDCDKVRSFIESVAPQLLVHEGKWFW